MTIEDVKNNPGGLIVISTKSRKIYYCHGAFYPPKSDDVTKAIVLLRGTHEDHNNIFYISAVNFTSKWQTKPGIHVDSFIKIESEDVATRAISSYVGTIKVKPVKDKITIIPHD